MNESSIGAQTAPSAISVGSIEQAVATIDSRLERLGHLIVGLEDALHQVLRGHQLKDASAGAGRSMPSTPLAAHLEEVISGIENLTSRIESIRDRVDI